MYDGHMESRMSPDGDDRMGVGMCCSHRAIQSDL